MSDIFEQTSLYRSFRQFCIDTSGDLADKFNRSIDEWDPHILLLLNGLLFVGSQLQGHTDQRMNELLQQLAYHFAPGEVMARPAAHMLHFQSDITRFQPGAAPLVEPLTALRDDSQAVLGHLGAAPFYLHPGLSIERLEPLTEADRVGVRLHLESQAPIVGPQPPIRCYLLDGPNDANYQLLDILSFPGVGCGLLGVSVVPTPQSFELAWRGSPWYKEQLRYLDPYPGDMDLFFEIRGLQPKHWREEGGRWVCQVDVLLPVGCSLAQPKRLSTIKIRANTTPILAYQQMPDVMLSGYQQELINRRAEDVVWLRAWEKNQELFQPGSLYFGDLLEQSEPHLWFWSPADSSPLIAELRAQDREVRIESLVVVKRRDVWGRKRVENISFEWDASPKLKKQYNAGVILFPVGRIPMLPRRDAEGIKERLWGWMANNFLLTEDHGQLTSFLQGSLRALGLENVALSDEHEQRDGAVTFSHVPGQGLTPAFGIDLTLPEDVRTYVAGDGTRGKLWLFLRRLAPFLQERLPPHLQLVMTMNHQEQRGERWCLRGAGESV